MKRIILIPNVTNEQNVWKSLFINVLNIYHHNHNNFKVPLV